MCEGWTGVSRCTCLYMSFWIFTAYSWIVLLLSRTERPPEKPPCPLPSAALRAASTCTDYGSFWISTTNTWIVTHKKLSNTSVWIRVCVLSWTSIHIWYHDIILEIKTWHMVCQFICVYIIYIIDYFYTNQYTIILYTFVCVHVGAMIHAHIHCTYPVLLHQMLIQRRSWPIENLAAWCEPSVLLQQATTQRGTFACGGNELYPKISSQWIFWVLTCLDRAKRWRPRSLYYTM